MEKALEQNPSDCLKIVLFGPESTGKTTLAKQLSQFFEEPWVPEFMRTYLEAKWNDTRGKIDINDLLPIAAGQIASENERATKAKKVLFCDTNLLEIKTYSIYYYNDFCPLEISEAIKKHTYNLYFLMGVDVPWEKDKLRDRPADRQNMFCIFERTLINNNLPYIKLTGSKTTRFNLAVQYINQLLEKK